MTFCQEACSLGFTDVFEGFYGFNVLIYLPQCSIIPIAGNSRTGLGSAVGVDDGVVGLAGNRPTSIRVCTASIHMEIETYPRFIVEIFNGQFIVDFRNDSFETCHIRKQLLTGYPVQRLDIHNITAHREEQRSECR